MKRVCLVLVVFLLLVGVAFAVDKPVKLRWEQPCVNGCPELIPPVGPVEEWRVYMSDTSGVYGTTPIITMPYDGTSAPTYESAYILVLEGAGTKYFIVRSWNSSFGESGNSNEVDYPYNFAGSAIPVNLLFVISEP